MTESFSRFFPLLEKVLEAGKIISMKTENTNARIFSFPPAVGTLPEFLILGSMPGEESLRKQQYYAHPKNLFWKIMGALWGFNHEETPYAERLEILGKNKIALWDVSYSCVRTGSMDSDIRDMELNDFDKLFSSHSSLKKVLCNGKTSFRIFSKYASANKASNLRIIPLPSTSPAFASMRFEQKLTLWRDAFI